MGFLERAIRRGVSQGVGNAVGKAIQQAVEPKATELANKAAEHIDQAAQSTAQQTQQTAVGLNGAFSNLQRAAEGYATQMSNNMKICPACGEPTGADKRFCPSCGAKLPETTVAQGAVCPSCGKQNAIGTKFCADCGTKLPAAIQEEQAAQTKDAQIMAQWDEKLPQYPKWCFGGKDFNIEENDGYIMFTVQLESSMYPQGVVSQYCELLRRNGFRPAGEYPDPSHLYKMVDGVCYHCDTEHCFDGDDDWLIFSFTTGEPMGGFDYVKPEPKIAGGLKDIFEF